MFLKECMYNVKQGTVKCELNTSLPINNAFKNNDRVNRSSFICFKQQKNCIIWGDYGFYLKFTIASLGGNKMEL